MRKGIALALALDAAYGLAVLAGVASFGALLAPADLAADALNAVAGALWSALLGLSIPTF